MRKPGVLCTLEASCSALECFSASGNVALSHLEPLRRPIVRRMVIRKSAAPASSPSAALLQLRSLQLLPRRPPTT